MKEFKRTIIPTHNCFSYIVVKYYDVFINPIKESGLLINNKEHVRKEFFDSIK